MPGLPELPAQYRCRIACAYDYNIHVLSLYDSMKLGQKIAIAYLRTHLALLATVSPKAAAKKAFSLFCTPTLRTKKSVTPLFEQAEKLRLSVDGIEINGFRWNKGAHPRVQVVHGFESASQNFEAYIDSFIQKGYE